MRRRLIPILAAAALTGCGGGGAVQQAAAPAPTGGAVAIHRGDPPPRIDTLRPLLTHQMTLAGPVSGAYVYDITAKRAVFADRATVPRVPASVEKLYTSAVALAQLGPSARLRTEILGSGRLRGHTWHGDLYLRGAGDPTFGSSAFDSVWTGGIGATDAALARRLRRAGIRRVTGRLIADGSLFDTHRGVPSTGLHPDVLDLGGELGALTYNHGTTALTIAAAARRHGQARPPASPGAYTAAQVAQTLRAEGVAVSASPRESVAAPAGSRVLASVSSPPLADILRLMNLPSDDFYAEMLLKQLGAQAGGAGSTAAGAEVVSRALGAIGVHPRVVDGSGLSRANSTTPMQVVRVLEAVAAAPYFGTLHASLPVPGVSGTLRRRMKGTAASRRCVGKTGSLLGVLNLAGYCRNAENHLLAYAIFMQGPDLIAQRAEQDRMLVALASR